MTTPNEVASGFALIRECNDAASLFSRGLATTRAIRTDYQDAVVVMSLLALGAEKMLKVTIGLANRDQAGTWPTKDFMRWEIGHRVATADRKARPLLDLYPGTAPGWLDTLKADVASDQVLPNLLDVLERFGNEGRFYYLDVLAEKPQPEPAPQMLWTDMTTAIASNDPTLLADIASPEQAERGRRRLNEIIAASLTRWWDLYVAAIRTGAIGTDAQPYAGELMLQPPTTDTRADDEQN